MQNVVESIIEIDEVCSSHFFGIIVASHSFNESDKSEDYLACEFSFDRHPQTTRASEFHPLLTIFSLLYTNTHFFWFVEHTVRCFDKNYSNRLA